MYDFHSGYIFRPPRLTFLKTVLHFLKCGKSFLQLILNDLIAFTGYKFRQLASSQHTGIFKNAKQRLF